MPKCELTDLSKANSFAELYSTIKNCRAEVTFWGHRVVKKGAQSVSIDNLTFAVLERLRKNPDFMESERLTCKKLSEKITRLYSSSKFLVGEKNHLTRFFFYIVELWINCSQNWNYKVREKWNFEEDFHMLYTTKQFRATFDHTPHHDFFARSAPQMPDRFNPPPPLKQKKESQECLEAENELNSKPPSEISPSSKGNGISGKLFGWLENLIYGPVTKGPTAKFVFDPELFRELHGDLVGKEIPEEMLTHLENLTYKSAKN